MTPRRLRAVALGVAVSLGAGCATARPGVPAGPAAAPPETAPASASAPAPVEGRESSLSRAIDEALASPAFARASVGLVVQSLATGRTLYRRNGQTWLVPASTMKVLTAVAAAERLGWGYRFETRLVAMGPTVDGVLDGDLLVVGTGDPTINRRHPSRVDALDAWAAALRDRGIRRIAGRVIGDDRLVEPLGWGIGWAWDDLVEDYGAAYGALQYNENVVGLTVGPGITPGAPPVLYLSPAEHGLLVDLRATTAPEGTPASFSALRQPGTRLLEIRGQVPLDGPPMSTTVAVPDPARFFAGQLRQALLRHGIEVSGAGIDVEDADDPPRASDGTTLLVDQSAPLSEIAAQMLAWSINLYAETLVVALDQTPPASAVDGLEVLRSTLEALGVPRATYLARDGSGLSRNDYLSADALVAALTAAWHSPRLRGPLVAALPFAGGPGTLQRRLAGTPAAGRVRAKTGSMSNVRSLAGYVDTLTGEPLVFAFLANGFDVRPTEIDAGVDALLQALVALPPD
ncbi:MAG: D-alanyl-D-alanine carboxypeptidase/D-alanyl-D-alanine-endopeptidase [Vicinamibacterales bacterium]